MTTDITELAQSHEVLIANGQQTADLLRHLADNEINSDYFAVVSECESYGKETDAELSITEFALRAAGYVDALVKALERAHQSKTAQREYYEGVIADGGKRIAELEESHAQVIQSRDHYKRMTEEGLKQLAEARTVKLPDGWQFEECEIEGCENGAIFSVGTGSRNIHLCDKCAHEPQNSRLKKSPLPKRLPFKMSAGIKVEAE